MLTKLDTRKILINVQNIQTVEANPDTVVFLDGGKKILVKESLEEIYEMLQDN
jgi:flagellar protein FlbD